MIVAPILLLMFLGINSIQNPSAVDSDSDGLADELEQELLTKFAPKFMVSSNECDGFPAEFQEGSPVPKLLARNGTIYGQVFPITLPGKPGNFVEIHYYHLWNRDCGLNGHKLDAEHVSALMWAASITEPSVSWRAKYWYAAAHEGTVCDSSHATQSWSVNAEQEGPTIWISAGKHASFLDQELCRGGCGGDSCRAMQRMAVKKIVNLGERNAPMNGVSWIEGRGWPLADKMKTDFPEPVLDKLGVSKSAIVPINESQAPVKTTIFAGNAAAGAITDADPKTDAALSTTSGTVEKSTIESTEHAGNALKRAAEGVWKALKRAVNKSP